MTMQISCTYNDTVQHSPENVLTLEKAEKVNLTSAFLITRNTDDSLLLYKTCFQARHERDRTGKTHLYGYSVLFYGGYGEPLFLCWQSTLVGCSLFDFSATQHMCLVCARIRIMKRLRGMTYLMQRDKKVLPIIVNQSFGHLDDLESLLGWTVLKSVQDPGGLRYRTDPRATACNWGP
ncbi:hypothetical protein BY458DRAFT_544159 [Sporodiniella umbellata]|nr:hypothetical protein BY458DRAFT_544159 [Sporodiniella umbellata]